MNDCIKCKHGFFCCTLKVKLSMFDMVRLWLGYKRFDYIDKMGSVSSIKLVKGDCFFLRRKGKSAFCKVYRYRPKACRDFPHGIKCSKLCEMYNKRYVFDKI